MSFTVSGATANNTSYFQHVHSYTHRWTCLQYKKSHKRDSPGTIFTPHPDVTPNISPDTNHTPKSFTVDRLEALLQMQRTDPFCKCISKCLFNGKATQHETDIFTHVKGLQYKQVTDSGQKFLALVIPKSWKYTVLVEAHDKLGHQGHSHTYFLVKRQYYWKDMNKDIRKYIANCTLCHREKAKIQHYPLQMMEIPDMPFDKIATSSQTVIHQHKVIYTS